MKTHTTIIVCAAASALLACVTIGCKDKTATTAPAGSSSAAAVTSVPHILVEKTEHDFGTVIEGDVASHTFVIKNTGNAPLIIERVRSSCGCTAVVTKEKEVPPGGTTEVRAEFNTTGRSGKNAKTITLETNDPDNPSTSLEIRAMIEKLLGFEPSLIRLQTDYGKPKSAETWLTGKLAPEAKPTLGELPDKDTHLKVELINKQEGDQTVHGLRFTLDAKKIGRNHGSVSIKTGVEKAPEVNVRFNVVTDGNLTIRPAALVFDSNPGSATTRSVRIASKLDNFKVTKATVVKGPYEATLVPPSEKDTHYEIKVTKKQPPEGKAPTAQDAKKPEDIQKGLIQVITNDPVERKVEIEIDERTIPVASQRVLRTQSELKPRINRQLLRQLPDSVRNKSTE